jgi:hypothetical protein
MGPGMAGPLATAPPPLTPEPASTHSTATSAPTTLPPELIRSDLRGHRGGDGRHGWCEADVGSHGIGSRAANSPGSRIQGRGDRLAASFQHPTSSHSRHG